MSKHLDEMAAVEGRARAARITMADLCIKAKVHHSVWSRAKRQSTVRVSTLDKIERALAAVEAERRTTPESSAA